MATITQTDIELSLLDRDDRYMSPTTGSKGQMPASLSHSRPTSVTQNNDERERFLTVGRSIIAIIQLAGVNFITSYNTGLVTVALPAMSKSLDIHPSLLLWPMSAYTLTMATCLLPAGAVADVLGPRMANLAGCFFIALFILVSGFSQTGIQLIIFRAMQGIAGAFAIPSSMSIVSTSIEYGRRRNIGFACLGLAQPLGFSFGLVLGGVFVSGPGWRVGSYIGGAVGFLLFVVGIWAVPSDDKVNAEVTLLRRLAQEVDWVGATIVSASIALLCYILAMLSADISNIKRPLNIVLLILSISLIPIFVWWMHRQARKDNVALIPNSLWKNRTFTSICLMVLLANALIFGMELFSSLFFQEVQGLSALQTSIRFLPGIVVGIATNFTVGMFINKIPAIYVVLGSSVLCSAAPLLMALINPQWPFWYNAFFAQLLSPLSIDVLFTVGILIISDVFPANTQALAGAVFNAVSQLGTSIGLCILQVISIVVTRDSHFARKASPEALLEGYKASFWTTFGFGITACFVGAFGLRRLGKVGEKRD